MNAERAGMMQMQLRHNADELQSYLKDLQSWEDEIKEKDKNLSKQKPILKEDLPPVRSNAGPGSSTTATAGGEKRKKRRKKNNGVGSEKQSGAKQSTRIRSYDYKAWDKFDVDKACEDVDYRVRSSSSSSESESNEELEEEERRKQEAIVEKERGNAEFKRGEYELAVESYSRAMELDPLSAVMPANRAMAHLKLNSYAEAEKDCSLALALDDSYVKAYYRRATARVKLQRLDDAKLDYESILRLEPGNKQAKAELEAVYKELARKKGYIFPIKRPPHLRSKKPLKRVYIEDIGGEREPPAGSKLTSPGEERLMEKPTKIADSQSMPSSTSESKTTVTELGTPEAIEKSQPSNHNTAPLITELCEDGASSSGAEIPARSEGKGTKIEVVKETQNDSTTGSDTILPGDASGKHIIVVHVPDVPDTSLQFQADWKRLRRDSNALTTYFKSIPLSKYPVILQQSLETDIFSEIITILRNDYTSCGVSCLQELIALSKVKRFSVAIMFLSTKDKQNLVELFRGLLAITDQAPDKATITSLSKDYAIDL